MTVDRDANIGIEMSGVTSGKVASIRQHGQDDDEDNEQQDSEDGNDGGKDAATARFLGTTGGGVMPRFRSAEESGESEGTIE